MEENEAWTVLSQTVLAKKCMTVGA